MSSILQADRLAVKPGFGACTSPMKANPISDCRGCGAGNQNFETILEMDAMPLAGVFCDSIPEALQAPVFPLTWIRCRQCALVQVLEDISDVALYQKYNYSSSSVPGLVQHFVRFSEVLRSRYSSDCSFMEIGCNDGVLLRMLPRNWRISGVDPSDVAKRAGAAGSYALYNVPFNTSLIREQKLEGTFDVISGSNCLAHISNLKEVFEATALALRYGGHFWIEVHDLKALLHDFQWDTIYHEHKAEWSEESLRRCLSPIGFSLVSSERLPLHGGILRVCFEKKEPFTIRETISPIGREFVQLRETYLRRYETPAIRKLQDASHCGLIAAYGASGRANVFLNQLLALRFSFVVDEAPLRKNKFLPQTATPVLGPEMLKSRVTHCLITAWNYKADIIRKNSQFEGEWLAAF